MAKQDINVGSAANSGDGDPLRTAFQKCVNNFNELYTDDAGDVNSITATAPISRDSATGAVTISLTNGGISTQKIANDAVTTDKLANAINTAITANTAKTTNATHTGDVTGSGALTIGNDKVTFATLENRYTALSALGSGSSFALNFITATTFTATATGAATFTFSNAVQGQVIDLIVTGNHALTFAESGATFNKVGSTSYAGASTNLIQIVCTKDTSGSRIYHYSIATFAAAQPQ